ncbi:uncharacterized protein LOC143242365 [Tachypleus tridentatus]|uniref:uncharacterized protein LOC143242365 n=1 Tax=Tachypleus tridentatus TaxID=6853 RepID=UPI003FCF3684
MDANDNMPIFLQPRYDAVLNTDMRSFNQRLIVKAFDADEMGPNSNVTYEIISGNYQDKFQINPISGEITLKEPLADVTNQESHNLPPITLNVRAHDQGIPVQSSSVEVQVHNQEYLNRTIMFIIPLPAEEIRHRKYEIERSFNTLTGARVSIYSVRPYNGSQSSSVAYAWVAYPLNSIIDVFSMEDAISTIYGRQYILQDKSEIREVRQEDYDIVFWFLITIVIILLLLLLLLLMYCCCCYRGKVWRKEYMKASSKVGPVEHIVTIQEKGSAENKDGQRKEPWHEDEARVWKYSQISPNHRRGGMDNHRDYRHERVERVYHERRLVSPDDRIRYTELPRDITGGQQVGNYYVVHRNIKNGQWKDGDRYRAYQFDDSNKPRRTEILYIKSPIHDPEVHTLRYRGEADEEEVFRSVSQQESIRDRQEQRDSRSYDALHQPRKIVYRDESDPRDQQLKFSRYHRTNSDVYIPNVDGDMFSRPVQYGRTQAAENGNFTMPEEKGRSQIIHGEDSCWRDKFEVEQRFVKRFEENEKPQCNSGIQNTFHVTEQRENIHQQLEPQDRITLVYGEYKQQPPDVNRSYQRINSYQMTSNDAMHCNEPSTNPNMTRREIIREYRYSNNKVDQCSQNNQSSAENQEDKTRTSQDNETVYVENYSGQQKLEDVIQGNMQDTSVNPILMQKEIITEYRYSNNEMDQCPKNNKNSAKDEMNKTKIVRMDNENHSKHQTDESINQKSEPNPVSSSNLSNQPITSREIQNSFMNTIQPQDSTSEMHVVKENHVTHQGNNINLHVEQKEKNSNNFFSVSRGTSYHPWPNKPSGGASVNNYDQCLDDLNHKGSNEHFHGHLTCSNEEQFGNKESKPLPQLRSKNEMLGDNKSQNGLSTHSQDEHKGLEKPEEYNLSIQTQGRNVQLQTDERNNPKIKEQGNREERQRTETYGLFTHSQGDHKEIEKPEEDNLSTARKDDSEQVQNAETNGISIHHQDDHDQLENKKINKSSTWREDHGEQVQNTETNGIPIHHQDGHDQLENKKINNSSTWREDHGKQVQNTETNGISIHHQDGHDQLENKKINKSSTCREDHGEQVQNVETNGISIHHQDGHDQLENKKINKSSTCREDHGEQVQNTETNGISIHHQDGHDQLENKKINKSSTCREDHGEQVQNTETNGISIHHQDDHDQLENKKINKSSTWREDHDEQVQNTETNGISIHHQDDHDQLENKKKLIIHLYGEKMMANRFKILKQIVSLSITKMTIITTTEYKN